MNSCLKPLANTHESYLQDTPYFLREVEELDESGKVRNSDILVTVDLSSLYTNIDEGLEAVKDTKSILWKGFKATKADHMADRHNDGW